VPALVVVPQNEEYLLADALVSWDVNRFRIALNVNNLLDKRFTTQCAYARGGAEFCALGYARDARLSVGYRW
jgi:iron complex outermembrane receptor protein